MSAIKSDDCKKHPLHSIAPTSRKHSTIARRTLSVLRYFVLLLATRTKSKFPLKVYSLLTALKAALITLRERLRSTALPIFLLVVIPTRQTPTRFLFE